MAKTKRVRTIERLITDAERRLHLAKSDVKKVSAELDELVERLDETRREEEQLHLPLEAKVRGLSEKWGAVLNFMVLREPNPVSIDEILQFAAENDLAITRSSARAQLYNYSQRGFVERISDGHFVATNDARDFCEY
jgi:hypothetical protein